MSWLPTTQAAFIPERRIGSWEATITLEETAQDDLEITQHPVQDGAAITDHAYKKPTTLNIRAQYSPMYVGVPLDEMYQRLLKLQSDRIPIEVLTGKRLYGNMLVKSVSETTDKDTSQILNVSLTLQQVILTTVSTVKVPAASQKRAAQREPERTGSTEEAGTKNAASESAAQRSSALRDLFGGN